MKTKALVLGLAVSFATSSALLAADKDQKGKETIVPTNEKALKAEKQETKKVELTGSYIKRDVKKRGRVTDGPDTVYVLDNDMIRQTGAADVSQVLIRRGFRR